MRVDLNNSQITHGQWNGRGASFRPDTLLAWIQRWPQMLDSLTCYTANGQRVIIKRKPFRREFCQADFSRCDWPECACK